MNCMVTVGGQVTGRYRTTVHKIAFRASLPLLVRQSGTWPMVIAESSAADEKELVARFGKEYRLAQAKIMREIERKVCGLRGYELDDAP